MLNSETLQGAIGALYDTAVSDDAWPAALGQLGRLFGCHFADRFQRTNDYTRWRGTQVGLDERDYQDVFLGYWVKNNVWGKRRPTRQSGDIVTTREMISVGEMQRSDMYSEYLRPRQLEEGLRLDVRADAAGVEDVSLLRPFSAGAYAAHELRAARVLMPHLQRASMVRRELAEAVGLAEAGLASLEAQPMAVLMLRKDGRVAYANRAAELMLAAEDPLGAGPDGLTGATTAGTRALRRLVHDATAPDRGPPRSGSVRLACASGRPAVLAVAMPIRPGVHDPFEVQRPTAMLCLIDRSQHRAPTQGQMMALFGLTPSEADLANEMLAGRPLQDIARRTGRSVHTVRTLLGRVMAKTETNRQAELVGLLTKLPQEAGPADARSIHRFHEANGGTPG